MKTIDVAGLKLVADSRTAVIESIKTRLGENKPTKIFTPYSEFLVSALLDKSFLAELNKSDINLPDGVGVIWAANFLNTGRMFQNNFFEAVRLFLRVALTGASIMLRPQSIYRLIPEKIPGSEFVYDLCSMAEQKQRSVFLWVGLMREYAKGSAPEAVHGLLFWGAKQMVLKARSDAEAARGRALAAALAALPHESRRKGEDLSYALERFALTEV
jgi:UDP-N-acetyl-D-mannosaminuronic acid transferase (WecB/TagA/CpsF family)